MSASQKMHFARATVILLTALLLLPHCARRAASNATSGALEELQTSVEAIPEEQQGLIAERNSKAAIRGILDELSTPERQAQLAKTIETAMSQALNSMAHPSAPPNAAAGASTGTGGSGTGGGGGTAAVQAISGQIARGVTLALSRQLQKELGPEGEGPLTTAIAGSTERLSASAVAGVRQELEAFTGPCSDPDPRKCLDRRVHELGKAATSGVVAGLKVPLLVVVFVLGFGCAALLFEVLHLRRKNKELQGRETRRRLGATA